MGPVRLERIVLNLAIEHATESRWIVWKPPISGTVVLYHLAAPFSTFTAAGLRGAGVGPDPHHKALTRRAANPCGATARRAGGVKGDLYVYRVDGGPARPDEGIGETSACPLYLL